MTIQDPIIMRDYKVVEANPLAQQKYIKKKSRGQSFTLREEKAFAYIVSKIKPTETTLEPITFDITEFCQICGINERYNYSPIIETLDRLLSRHIWVSDEESKSGLPFFSRITVNQGTGTLTVVFNQELKDYFVQLKGNFFQFTIRFILAMETAHGVQLYKLLKSFYFKNRKTIPAPIEINVDDLKAYLDCYGRYEKIKDFRHRVLDPALKDINQYSDLQVDMEPIKTGRNITSFIFHTIDLVREDMPEDRLELDRRLKNVDRKINPDQLCFDGFFDGIGDYP